MFVYNLWVVHVKKIYQSYLKFNSNLAFFIPIYMFQVNIERNRIYEYHWHIYTEEN
jgi:hypothetical protein